LTAVLCQRIITFMDDSGHFERLVSELSLEERTGLLEKLSTQSSLTSSVLYEAPRDEGEFTAEAQYQNLPWYYKIWFFILSFFNPKPPQKLFEDYILNGLYRDLEEKHPGFYNFQKDILLEKFQEELIKLRDASRFFYNALDASLNRDKGGLMVFLGSLEMPDIHKRLIADTDPGSLSSNNRELGEIELRQKAVRILEDTLSVITEAQRNKMYNSTRTLHCLKQLSSFLFDRLCNSFIYDSSFQGNICPASAIRDQIISLNNILSSLKTIPPIALLESLFIYILQEKSDEPNFNIHNEMRKLLVQAETSLAAIRDFNKEVPLTKLLRCIFRNPGLKPQNIGGGEDWFIVYRDRWKFQVEDKFVSFTKTRRQKDLQNAFRYFLKGANLKLLDYMESNQNPDGINVKGSFCLSFLQTFYNVIFMGDLNKYLKPILLEGDFVKKENRAEFAECYNNLIKLEDLIKRFDHEISPDGDIGKRYIKNKNEMTSLPIKRRKAQIIMEEAAGTALDIISQTREALEGMIRILEGINKKNTDGKYDTLTNISVIAGRGASFQEGINESIDQLKKTLQLLDDIDAMETQK